MMLRSYSPTGGGDCISMQHPIEFPSAGLHFDVVSAALKREMRQSTRDALMTNRVGTTMCYSDKTQIPSTRSSRSPMR